MQTNHPQNIKRGILYGTISAFFFALMSVLVKKIGSNLPTSMLLFFRFGTSLILILPWVIKSPNFSFKVQQPARYAIRIVSALLGLFFVFYTIKFIPLVDVLLLNNTAPLFVPIVALLLIGVKTSHKAYAGIFLGFIGVVIILNPGHEIISPAALMALASGVLVAIAIVQIRILSKTSSATQMLFYYFLVSTIICGAFTFFEWRSPPNLTTWLLLVGIGLCGTIYQTLATLTYATAPVRLMSPLIFLMVVFGGFFDWLVWHHTPSLLTILGALLVIIGAGITIYFGQK